MQQLHQRQAAVSSVLPPVPALCTLLLRRYLYSQSGQSSCLWDSSTCSMPNNIPSAVSMLPQNMQSAPSDAHRTVFKAEVSSKTRSKEPYDASVLLRAPLRALNRVDHVEPDAGKRAVQHAPSGVPALDSALRGVHVYKLSDGTFSRILPCTFAVQYHVCSAGNSLPPSGSLSQLCTRLRSTLLVPFYDELSSNALL